MLTVTTLNLRTSQLLSEYKALVVKKIESLTELKQIERSYMVTLPGAARKKKKNDEQMNESKVKNIIDHMNPQDKKNNFSKSKTIRLEHKKPGTRRREGSNNLSNVITEPKRSTTDDVAPRPVPKIDNKPQLTTSSKNVLK